jgi:hypothetical protein
LDKERDLQIVEGIVDRVGVEVVKDTGSIYYVHIQGIPHLFTSGAGLSAEIPVTGADDKVRIEFYNSPRDVLPMHAFDNLSLTLSESLVQKTIKDATIKNRAKDEAAQDTATLSERVKRLTPEQLQQLKDKLPPVK